MKTRLRLAPALALLAMILAGVPALAGAGRLQQRYLAVNYDFFVPESAAFDNGGGFTLNYNQPFNDSADVGLVYSHLTYDAARPGGGDATKQRFMVYGSGIGELDRDVPFFSFGLGWGRDEYGTLELEAVLFSIRMGAEWKYRDVLAVTAYAAWTDSFGSEVDGYLSYGATVDHDFSSSVSGMVALEGDDHFNVKISLGAVFRF